MSDHEQLKLRHLVTWHILFLVQVNFQLYTVDKCTYTLKSTFINMVFPLHAHVNKTSSMLVKQLQFKSVLYKVSFRSLHIRLISSLPYLAHHYPGCSVYKWPAWVWGKAKIINLQLHTLIYVLLRYVFLVTVTEFCSKCLKLSVLMFFSTVNTNFDGRE